MTSKNMEGDENQRRTRARQARDSGSTPSAELVTRGASKQRNKTGQKEPHQDRLAAETRGKQKSPEPEAPRTPAPSPFDQWSRQQTGHKPTAGRRGTINLSPEQDEVYAAVAELEASGEPVYLSRIAAATHRPELETRRIVGDLLDANLIQEVAAPDQPDLGLRYALTAKT
jgi:hypothetical protein